MLGYPSGSVWDSLVCCAILAVWVGLVVWVVLVVWVILVVWVGVVGVPIGLVYLIGLSSWGGMVPYWVGLSQWDGLDWPIGLG